MTFEPISGDPELLPKPVVEAPTTRRIKFGPSGVLLPAGPEYDVSVFAPDVADLPYQRFATDAWTSPEQRVQILDYLKTLFASTTPLFSTWRVIERDRIERMSALRLKDPYILIIVVRKSDRAEFEVSIRFRKDVREDLVRFRAELDLATPSLLVQSSA